MRYIAVDSETIPFSPGNGAPSLVCLQWQAAGEAPNILTRRKGALAMARRLLESDDILVGHSISYDLAVFAAEGLAPLVFRKLRRGLVICTWVYERLGEISGRTTRKALDFATCCKAHGIAVPDTKGKGYETEFAQFIDADEIPDPHRSYALNDLLVGKLHERQRARFYDVPERAVAHLTHRQFCLQLMSVWGMITDGDAVAALERDAREALAGITPQALELGFVRKDGSRNMKAIRAAVEKAFGAACPRTPTGLAQTSEIVLEAADSPALKTFAEYATLLKTLGNDVPNLRASGTGWISTRYGMCETLRTSSSGDRKGKRSGLIAMQNLKQFGGVRECIRPRPGFEFYNVDAKGLELRAFADLCASKGWTSTAALIRQGGTDAVLNALGAALARQPVPVFVARLDAKDEQAIAERTRGKNALYGFMGGMGPDTYVDFIAKMSKGKIKIDGAEARLLRETVFQVVPDLKTYLRWVGDSDQGDGTFNVELEYGIARAGVWYSAKANNGFQARAAAAMSEVVIDLVEACYIGHLAPARPCLFVHDELLVEVPAGTGHEFEVEFLKLAEAATSRICKHVPLTWEGELTDRYSKRAKRVEDASGRLCVWRG